MCMTVGSQAHGLRRIVIAVMLLVVMGCEGTSGNAATLAETNRLSKGRREIGIIDGKSLIVSDMEFSQEGVFFLGGGYCNMVLELQGGRYRCWEASCIPGPASNEPLTGTYAVDGPDITLLDMGEAFELMDQWRFRRFNGMTTLWGELAIQRWREDQTVPGCFVLLPIKAKADELWRSPATMAAMHDERWRLILRPNQSPVAWRIMRFVVLAAIVSTFFYFVRRQRRKHDTAAFTKPPGHGNHQR